MSWDNDTCDFCKHYMDPIGCDTKTPIGTLAWCGQCYDGMHYQWRNFSDADLKTISDYYQAEYDRDPIDFDQRTTSKSTAGEKFVAHARRMRQLECMDTASQTRQYVKMRAERKEKV